MSGGGTPAGWYPDPSSPGVERWWNGVAWGQEVRPAGGHPPVPTPMLAPPMLAPPAPRRTGCFGIATGVMLGILGAVVVVVGGCTALVVAARAGNDDNLVSVTTVRPSGGPASSTGAGAGPGASGSVTTAAAPAAGDEAADVIGCTRVNPDTIVLELVNNSSKTSSYSLNIVYLDATGTRRADGTAFINNLRPGERAIQETFVFEKEGTTCEVAGVDRFASESDAGELADIGPCQLDDLADSLGFFQVTVSATNSTPETSDYLVDVAIVDSTGVRRGTATASIEAVRPQETAPSDALTATKYKPDHRCEVVAVSRTAS